MKRKYFTLLCMVGETGRWRVLRIPKWLFYAALCVVGVGMLFSLAGVLPVRPGREKTRLAAVERENAILRARLAEYGAKIETLSRQVQQNFDFQKKARILANLGDIDEDVLQVGVGGPALKELASFAGVGESVRRDLSRISEEIDKLSRQAKLQRESYSEIVEKLAANKELLASTPSIRPVAGGYVSSRFGRRQDPFTGRISWHYGVDYSARLGTPIFATADGVVTFCGRWYEFGWTVEISHGHGIVTRYAHCAKLLVQKGQRVKRGDIIARVGSSGRSTATHVHYEVIVDGSKKDPLAYVLATREVVD